VRTLAFTLLIGILLVACDTTQVFTWPTGLSAADEKAISRLIATETKGKESIVNYIILKDGTISLHMSGPANHTFEVRHMNGRWRVFKEYVIVS
jgi:hypothetical protein